jgi:hypothetical protein
MNGKPTPANTFLNCFFFTHCALGAVRPSSSLAYACCIAEQTTPYSFYHLPATLTFLANQSLDGEIDGLGHRVVGASYGACLRNIAVINAAVT